MFYRRILSTFDIKIILVLIPRVVSIFFVIFQALGMASYPGGTILIYQQMDIRSHQIFFQIWVHIKQEMESQTIYQ